jgi:hypothetical protein
MLDHLEQLLAEYRKKGVLVDTNLLLLYVVGIQTPNRIQRFSRTDTFTEDDFDLLSRFLTPFETAVTTPSILTEVSNLLGQLPKQPRRECTTLFRDLIRELDDVYRDAEAICDHPYFIRFRLTDAGIADVSDDAYLVLTDDLPLYHRLAEDQQAVINFNHLRTANW